MMDKILYEYALVEIQERKLLQLGEKETLEEVVVMMNTMDNSEVTADIEGMIERISELEDGLKQLNISNAGIEEVEEEKEQEQESDNSEYQAKQQLISKINREKELISEMTRKAYAIAASNNIETEGMSEMELFAAIESLISRETPVEFPVTTRTNESAKLTQLLLKSKRSKDYEELISETRFKELYSNMHVSPE